MKERVTAFYNFGSFRLSAHERSLLNHGEPVRLAGKTYETLLHLVRNRDRVVEKDELMDALWPDSDVNENNLNQSISALRRILGERVGDQRYIKTVPGRGYRFIADVIELQEGSVGTRAEETDESSVSEEAEHNVVNPIDDEPNRVQTPPWKSERQTAISGRTKPMLIAAVALTCVVLGFIASRAVMIPEEPRAVSQTQEIQPVDPEGKKVEVWGPKDGARLSGEQTFKAMVTDLTLPQYTMYWQVDGDRLNPMTDRLNEYPHKEIPVNLSRWTWRGDGPYQVNFIARDLRGNTIAERAINIYVPQ